jgi:hypothetical protein
MADPKDSETSTTEPTPATSTPDAGDAPAAPTATPMIAAALRASRQAAAGESAAIGPQRPATDAPATKPASTDDGGAETPPVAAAAPSGTPRYARLAASVALAAALGAFAGAGAVAGLQILAVPTVEAAAPPIASPSPSILEASLTDATERLQETVQRLQRDIAALKSQDIAALKSDLAAAQRSASAQLGKLTETLDRLEKRAAKAAPEVTGSVTAVAKQQPKQETKPPAAEGWRLRDFYAGRAVVESPGGRLFDIRAGSNLPGLGRVEGIKREAGHVVVVTRNGTIAASLTRSGTGDYDQD